MRVTVRQALTGRRSKRSLHRHGQGRSPTRRRRRHPPQERGVRTIGPPESWLQFCCGDTPRPSDIRSYDAGSAAVPVGHLLRIAGQSAQRVEHGPGEPAA
jgi:hypothetical protein